MEDRGGEFCFFQGIHVRNDIRIDISVPIRPSRPKLSRYLHLEELTQIRIIGAGDLITSRSCDKLKTYLHYLSAYDQQTWQDGNLP